MKSTPAWIVYLHSPHGNFWESICICGAELSVFLDAWPTRRAGLHCLLRLIRKHCTKDDTWILGQERWLCTLVAREWDAGNGVAFHMDIFFISCVNTFDSLLTVTPSPVRVA